MKNLTIQEKVKNAHLIVNANRYNNVTDAKFLNIEGIINYALIEIKNTANIHTYEYNDSFTGKCVKLLDEYIIDVVDSVQNGGGFQRFYNLENALKGHEGREGWTANEILRTANFRLWLEREDKTLTIERFNRTSYSWENPLQECGLCHNYICLPSCEFHGK